MPTPRNHIDVGSAFGELAVLQVGLREEPRPSQAARGQPGERAALCSCSCGQQRLVRVGDLVLGRVTSCGCRLKPAREPATTGASAGRRSPRHIPVEQFGPLVAEAAEAYAIDVSYAIAMLNAATNIHRKRSTWVVRQFLREAEATARRACEAAGPRECRVTEPCGTGRCPFAERELAELVGVPSVGKINSKARASRPQPRPADAPGAIYSIESAVQPLLELRASRGARRFTA